MSAPAGASRVGTAAAAAQRVRVPARRLAKGRRRRPTGLIADVDGLRIIARTAPAWGSSRRRSGGKVVWATLTSGSRPGNRGMRQRSVGQWIPGRCRLTRQDDPSTRRVEANRAALAAARRSNRGRSRWISCSWTAASASCHSATRWAVALQRTSATAVCFTGQPAPEPRHVAGQAAARRVRRPAFGPPSTWLRPDPGARAQLRARGVHRQRHAHALPRLGGRRTTRGSPNWCGNCPLGTPASGCGGTAQPRQLLVGGDTRPDRGGFPKDVGSSYTASSCVASDC